MGSLEWADSDIRCKGFIVLPLYSNQRPAEWISSHPDRYVDSLDNQIRGFGPTLVSKLLRFALSAEYGAIDTKIVSVFGKEGRGIQGMGWLNLMEGGGTIVKQRPVWPDEYGTWINILRYIAKALNQKEIDCPHPDQFVQAGLRTRGKWFCADVEMAMFSYASIFF